MSTPPEAPAMGSETKRDVPENIVAEAKIPRGGIAHHVVLTRAEVILLGTPDNEEGNEDDLAHNCDAMGCGMDHVLVRIPLLATPTPAADGEAIGYAVAGKDGKLRLEARTLFSALLTEENAALYRDTLDAQRPSFAPHRIVPLYTRPAPVVTEAMVEAAAAKAAIVERVLQHYADAYPEHVWPETPFTDAQAASVMRLMVPRIRAAVAAATREGTDG